MTRSFKSPKQATTHDYKIATSPNNRKVHREGAGKFSWGSEQDMIHDFQSSREVDEIPLSISPQESKASFINNYHKSKTQEAGHPQSERQDSTSSSNSSESSTTSAS